jgi:hypothetical protein
MKPDGSRKAGKASRIREARASVPLDYYFFLRKTAKPSGGPRGFAGLS